MSRIGGIGQTTSTRRTRPTATSLSTPYSPKSRGPKSDPSVRSDAKAKQELMNDEAEVMDALQKIFAKRPDIRTLFEKNPENKGLVQAIVGALNNDDGTLDPEVEAAVAVIQNTDIQISDLRDKLKKSQKATLEELTQNLDVINDDLKKDRERLRDDIVTLGDQRGGNKRRKKKKSSKRRYKLRGGSSKRRGSKRRGSRRRTYKLRGGSSKRRKGTKKRKGTKNKRTKRLR